MQRLGLVIMGFLSYLAMAQEGSRREFPSALEHGKFFSKDGHRYLYGGDTEDCHFVIDNLILEPRQFHFGIGRELFPALLEPDFVTREQADSWLKDNDRVLGFAFGGDVKAYPIDLLEHHEVVNDVVGGVPVFAAYCVLADLGAMYDRRINDRVFTFALSGYTYFDPEVWDGLDGFVMWDRETESLWWPLIGKSVSGPMLNTLMKVFDESTWSQTTWGQWKEQHPQSLVLEKGQDFERPKSWPRFDVNSQSEPLPSDQAIAPRWGDND